MIVFIFCASILRILPTSNYFYSLPSWKSNTFFRPFFWPRSYSQPSAGRSRAARSSGATRRLRYLRFCHALRHDIVASDRLGIEGFGIRVLTGAFPSLRQAMTGMTGYDKRGGGTVQRRRKRNRFARKLGGNGWCFLMSRMVARLGLEPRQTDSESVVLPLHHRAKSDA